MGESKEISYRLGDDRYICRNRNDYGRNSGNDDNDWFFRYGNKEFLGCISGTLWGALVWHFGPAILDAADMQAAARDCVVNIQKCLELIRDDLDKGVGFEERDKEFILSRTIRPRDTIMGSPGLTGDLKKYDDIKISCNLLENYKIDEDNSQEVNDYIFFVGFQIACIKDILKELRESLEV